MQFPVNPHMKCRLMSLHHVLLSRGKGNWEQVSVSQRDEINVQYHHQHWLHCT